jgi:hypothetical protein
MWLNITFYFRTVFYIKHEKLVSASHSSIVPGLKCTVHPVTCHAVQRVGKGIALLSPNLGGSTGYVLKAMPSSFSPVKTAGTHLRDGFTGLRTLVCPAHRKY